MDLRLLIMSHGETNLAQRFVERLYQLTSLQETGQFELSYYKLHAIVDMIVKKGGVTSAMPSRYF
jgi:hypothetical protein